MKPWKVIKQWWLDSPEPAKLVKSFDTEKEAKQLVAQLVFDNFEAVELGVLKIRAEYWGNG